METGEKRAGVRARDMRYHSILNFATLFLYWRERPSLEVFGHRLDL